MPYNVAGDLQIVVSADIGEFGPINGKPVNYYFSRLYHILGIIPWLLLLFAFIALKENRTLQAIWILAPIALLVIAYLAVLNILRIDSGSAVQLNIIFTIIVLGFSMIWLLAERIGNRNRFVTFLLATLIYFGFLGVSLLSAGFSRSVIAIVSLAAVSIPAILFTFVIAIVTCPKPFNTARFIITVGVALFGVSLILFSITMFIVYQSQDLPISTTWITDLLTVSFFSSLIYYGGLIPFLILLFANPFWRKRFEAVLGIRPKISIEPLSPMKTS